MADLFGNAGVQSGDVKADRGPSEAVLQGGFRSWRQLSVFQVVVLVVVPLVAAISFSLGLAEGLGRLADRWAYAYKHGYLLAGMSAWLLFRSIRLSRPAVRPSWVGLLLLLAGVSVYTVAQLLDFTLGMQALLPVLLVMVGHALFGLQAARCLLLPGALLFFAVPVWDLAVGPLQSISTFMVTLALSFSTIPLHVEGHLIHLAAGTFEIAEGCSGQRYFMIALALAAFYGFAWLERWRSRIALLLVAGFLSMLSNWVRILILVLIGEFAGIDHPLIDDHDAFGWVLFAFVLIPMLWYARHLEVSEHRLGAGTGHSSAVEASLPVQLGGSFLLMGMLATLVLLLPRVVTAADTLPAEPAEIPLSAVGLDPRGDAERGSAPVLDRPHALGEGAFDLGSGHLVNVYLARYAFQHPDSKLIASRNRIEGDWQRMGRASRRVALSTEELAVNEFTLSRGGQHRLLWYWYRIGPFHATDHGMAKLLEVPALFLGRRDSGLAVLSVNCATDCDHARQLLQRFVEQHGAALNALAAGGG